MQENNFSIAVHGGAGDDTEFIRQNFTAYELALKEATEAGNKILADGGTAIDAVQKSVMILEDNPLFDAGRGSALNAEGVIVMDASIMNGKNLSSGAVSMLRNVKNPITLARYIMEHSACVFLSGDGALKYAKKEEGILLEPDAYFVTGQQVEEFIKTRNQEQLQDILKKKTHGTVGAVALDRQGNLAAATSTGGTCNSLPGRIGDSCIIGAGCFADNGSCAVSGTGDGELLINRTIARSVAAAVEYGAYGLQEACDLVIHEKNKDAQGDIGIIAANTQGTIGIAFNSKRMHRAWIQNNQMVIIKIFK